MPKKYLKIMALFFPVFLLLPLWSHPAASAWSNDSTQNTPVCTTPEDQRSVHCISDGSGGIFTAWGEGDFSTADVCAQRLGPAGEPLWPAGGLPICTAAGRQYSIDMIDDGAGGMIVVWVDGRSGADDAVYTQRIDADGTALWPADGVAVCTAASFQAYPKLVADDDGGAIVVWQDYRAAGGESDLYAQRLSRHGALLWPADGVVVCDEPGFQYLPDVISDGAGGAIIAWHDDRTVDTNILAQRVDDSGTILWDAAGVIVCDAAENQDHLRLAGDGSGGAIISWDDFRSGADLDIYAQRLDASGSVQWTSNGEVVSKAADHQYSCKITEAPGGGAFFSWLDNRSGDYDIYAQRLDGSGTALWTVNGVAVCTAAWTQTGKVIAADGSGGIVLAWNDLRPEGDGDIYAQRLDGMGNTLWAEDGVLVSGADGMQSRLDMVGFGTLGLVVVFRDQRSGADHDIYAQWVDADGQAGGFIPDTVSAHLTCDPTTGTVPFSTQMSLMLSNAYTGQTRRISAVINVTLGNGQRFTNWRAGYTNLGPHQNHQASWSQSFPAVASVIGDNLFSLRAEDVTPAPYNHPPYPSSGDVVFKICTVTASAP